MKIVTDVKVNPIIEKVFKNFEVDNIKFPIFYKKSPHNNLKNYLTYYTYSTQPSLFGDDVPVASIAYGTIDVYSEGNYLKVVKEIKKKLIENNFTWNGDGIPDYEEDTKLNHYPINFIKESED